MFRRLRVRAWCLATALVLALSTAGASFEVLLHDKAGHDPACVSGFAPHDPSAHRFQNASSSTSTDHGSHCLACHWARSFRHTSSSAHATPRLADAGAHRVARHIGHAGAPALAQLPARSPPAA
jgi:hypothetical protein